MKINKKKIKLVIVYLTRYITNNKQIINKSCNDCN